jgi:hypothetical protein
MAGEALYVEEYARQAKDNRGQTVAAGEQPPLAVQKVDFSAGAAASAAFNAKTVFVRIHTNAICSRVFSAAGTAAAVTDPRMVAGQTEFHGVIQGSGMKVSAIINT